MNMLNLYLDLLLACGMSLFCVNWIFGKVLQIAKIKSLVDNPNARKLQKTPVPVLGGLAVFFGLLMGMIVFYGLTGDGTGSLIPVILGAGVMLYIGSVDDIIGLTPRSRILIEIVVMLGLVYGSGMCVDSLHGVWGIYSFSWWIAVPLTVFAGVGLVNAFNMVDGVNGLSSGLCILVCFFFGVICWKLNDWENCALAACYGVSLIPFLLHNVFGKRSRMFIGDGGTMVMGFLVSWLVVRVLSSGNDYSLLEGVDGDGSKTGLGLIGMMLAITSIPVFDTIRVMAQRILRHESPFKADKTHLHHAFIAVGMSHSFTALSECLMNGMIVLIWYASYKAGISVDLQMYVTIASSMLIVWGTYVFLHYQYKHNTSFLEPLNRFTAKSHIGHTKWWLSFQARLDRGTYEDYLIVLRERLNKEVDDMSEEEQAEAAVVNYLQGKHTVKVADIVDGTRLDGSKVDMVLTLLEDEGILLVKKRNGETGAIEAVRLVYNAI